MPAETRRIFAVALPGGLFAALVSFGAAGLAPVRADDPTTAPRVSEQDGPAGVDPLAAELDRRYWEEVEPLLAAYCFGCHAGGTTKGGIAFDGIWTIEDARAMGDDLAAAGELLHARAMPPAGEPAPGDDEVEVITRWIADALDYLPPGAKPDPGWFVIHRLNRAEYRNTIRDLLGVDIKRFDPAAGLPQDDTGYGFDNIAAVLTMSPMQIEGYLEAAERSIEAAFGPVVEVSTEPSPLRGLSVGRGGRAVAGGFFLYSNGSVGAEIDIPLAAEYEITVRTWGQRAGDELPRLSIRHGRRELKGVFVEGTREEPQTVTVRARLEPGRSRIDAAFTNDFYQPDVADRNLAIESVEIAGPLNIEGIERPSAYDEVFFVRPDGADPDAERSAASDILTAFAHRAFRGTAGAGDIGRLLPLYDAARAAGDSHEEAVRVCLSAVLVSPRFLYRSVDNPHADDPDRVYTLDAPELASRLSYFLWSSTPDDELLARAADGSLTDPEVLTAQAARMLADTKSDAFIENFSGQWLLLRNLDRLAIDQSRYRAYDSELRDDMITEATMFFADVVRQDRSVLTFLDSDHTFVNGPLAALYGFAELAGLDRKDRSFRRVDLPDDSPRGGVLTMGAVLTVTSNPTRTSPVKRGLYVLDQILGTPPPPPPPEIAPLEQAMAQLGENPSLREQLAAHLTDMNCAVCHNRMDPLGLAMENFDAVGRWRDADESGPIDASGTLPDGRSFAGPTELKQILLARDDLFIENLTRKLLTYALGRGLESFDRPTVASITARTRDNGDRFSAIIEGIVLSDAFRTCRGNPR
tara:strand:+ start:11442 stop:13868 length:2427 start_codon:yes stop_codon:yes gene_type:complete